MVLDMVAENEDAKKDKSPFLWLITVGILNLSDILPFRQVGTARNWPGSVDVRIHVPDRDQVALGEKEVLLVLGDDCAAVCFSRADRHPCPMDRQLDPCAGARRHRTT
jgi:hypothetical protein